MTEPERHPDRADEADGTCSECGNPDEGCVCCAICGSPDCDWCEDCQNPECECLCEGNR